MNSNALILARILPCDEFTDSGKDLQHKLVNWSAANHMNIHGKKDEGNDKWFTATTQYTA